MHAMRFAWNRQFERSEKYVCSHLEHTAQRAREREDDEGCSFFLLLLDGHRAIATSRLPLAHCPFFFFFFRARLHRGWDRQHPQLQLQLQQKGLYLYLDRLVRHAPAGCSSFRLFHATPAGE